MIEPLSKKKRLWYLGLCVLAFVICTPVLIFYATGYRVTDGLNLGHTGGLYLSGEPIGTKVIVDNLLAKETSIFQRSVLIQNLKPGLYDITTSKDGFVSWHKQLNVYPETVTEAKVLMLRSNLTMMEATSSSTPSLKEVQTFFQPAKNATTTITLGKISLKKVSNRVVAQWVGNPEEKPLYFCERDVCRNQIILRTPEAVGSFDFFPDRNDVVLVTLPSGIYASELDDRSKQNLELVIRGEYLDFRVQDNVLYIKRGRTFYSVSL